MQAHVLRLRLKQPITATQRTRLARTTLPSLSAARGFVDLLLLENGPRELELVSLWSTATASKTKAVTAIFDDVVGSVKGKVLFAGPMKLAAPRLRFPVAKSEFPHNQGDYENPDAVVGPYNPPLQPRELVCPGGKFVIYVCDAQWVANCNGFGAGNANNALCNNAAAEALAAAKKITCPSDCTRREREIWRGWNCRAEGKGFIATGAAEVAVTCDVEH